MDLMQASSASESVVEGEYVYCDLNGTAVDACKKRTVKTAVNSAIENDSSLTPATHKVSSLNAQVKNAIASAVKKEKVATVWFEFDSAVLSDEQKHILKETMQGFLGKKMLVIGYTDSFGSQGVNAHLSKQRAENVKEFLMAWLSDVKKIDSNGRELCCYLVPTGNIEEQQQNRRVEIYTTE